MFVPNGLVSKDVNVLADLERQMAELMALRRAVSRLSATYNVGSHARRRKSGRPSVRPSHLSRLARR